MERVDRNSTRRRKKGRSTGKINATFDVDNRLVFSPIKTKYEYLDDVGRRPRTSALSMEDGKEHMYFVDSAGRILSENAALQVAESIQKLVDKGKPVHEKLFQAILTSLDKHGVYSNNSLRP